MWAALWLVAFTTIFYSFSLPNSNPPISRLDVWRQLPDVLLSSVLPDVDGTSSGWHNFPQRFDLLLVAAWILAGAWGLGHLVLRLLRFPRQNDPLEATVFAFGIGLSGASLLTLGCGLAGWLSRALLGGLLAVFPITELALRIVRSEGKPKPKREGRRSSPRITLDSLLNGRIPYGVLLRSVAFGVMGLFLLAMLLGAMLPSVDFDVKEYHLQGPKEFFQQSRVTMLPHNVYTSFPFLTEMLSLLGMVLRDDWFRGALAGKAVLMGFAPLTALAVFAAGRRWFGTTAGWLAAFVALTTPWTYRISIIAYTEGGLSFYLFATVLAVMLSIERRSAAMPNETERGVAAGRQRPEPLVFLSGLLAGSAMACKYPGLVQVVVPAGIAVAVTAWRMSDPPERMRAMLKGAGLFAVGTALTIGPWLMKNAVETGNPVYPLAYGVFGGKDWDPELNSRWTDAHSSDVWTLDDFGEKFVDVTLKSDWLSPLLFGLAPLALWNLTGRRRARWLAGYVAYLFLTWWFLTHRLDRFWVPMIPVVALLAGVGAAWRHDRLWVWTCGGVIFLAALFNLGFITTRLCGYNAYLADLNEAREAAESTAPGIAYLNGLRLPDDARVLCVGEAQVFDARMPVIYNTVFDRSIFEQWCAADAPGVPPGKLPMRSPEEIRRTFHEAGVRLVYVNWREILRYRPTYGYTDFVTPGRFEWLQEHGILGAALRDSYRFGDPARLSPAERRELETWGPELKVRIEGRPAFIAGQVFPVLP